MPNCLVTVVFSYIIVLHYKVFLQLSILIAYVWNPQTLESKGAVKMV